MLDLRATGSSGGASVLDSKDISLDPSAGSGSTITFDLYAVVFGAPGNTEYDELFQLVLTSILTYSDGPKNIHGHLGPAVLPNHFRASNSFAGALADLNGDGDLDLGGASSATTAAPSTYLKPRASTLLGAVPGISTDLPGDTVGREWRFGAVTLSIDEVVDPHGDPIHANFLIPTFTQEFSNLSRAVYCIDGIVQAGDPAPVPVNMSVGAPVTISLAAPEPSSFAMLLAGTLAVGGKRWPRRQISCAVR